MEQYYNAGIAHAIDRLGPQDHEAAVSAIWIAPKVVGVIMNTNTLVDMGLLVAWNKGNSEMDDATRPSWRGEGPVSRGLAITKLRNISDEPATGLPSPKRSQRSPQRIQSSLQHAGTIRHTREDNPSDARLSKHEPCAERLAHEMWQPAMHYPCGQQVQPKVRGWRWPPNFNKNDTLRNDLLPKGRRVLVQHNNNVYSVAPRVLHARVLPS
jgi:hypothetical protein